MVSHAAFDAAEAASTIGAVFTPSRDDVRAFFREARRKSRALVVAATSGDTGADGSWTPREAIAAHWGEAHPEYAAERDAADADLDDAVVGAGAPRENPFLHLSMHLAIQEQLQIDRPAGLRVAFESLAARLGSAHAAHHAIMECLGRELWEAQRAGRAIDDAAYLDCVQRQARG